MSEWDKLTAMQQKTLRLIAARKFDIRAETSAAKIAAACLQKYGLVVYVGDDLSDGLTLRVTDAGRALVESAASDEATDAQMQADAKAVREFVEHQHQQRETIRQQAAEIERLQASNAELRASADEAQTARLAAVAEAAALRERLAAAESRVKALEAALEEIDDVAMQAQGEWSSVEEPYAPEWTLDYKGVRDVVADALKGDAE